MVSEVRRHIIIKGDFEEEAVQRAVGDVSGCIYRYLGYRLHRTVPAVVGDVLDVQN